jgi:hypothetical protein
VQRLLGARLLARILSEAKRGVRAVNPGRPLGIPDPDPTKTQSTRTRR